MNCENKTGCVCPEPAGDELMFFCNRHGVKKTREDRCLCRGKQNYFDAWEERRGPGQQLPGRDPERLSPAANTPRPSRQPGGYGDSGKKAPSLHRQAWNLANSLAAFVADGLRTVDKEQYRERLEICDTCDRRRGNRCMKCGCRLSLKARGRAFKCPEGKWPEV